MRMIYLVFLISLSLIPLASSISTTMLPAYQPGETMIIEIQGNILEPINREDIIFRRAHVAIAVDYDVKRIGSKYYLYAQLPVSQNNYTLFINNIATTANGQNQIIDFNQSFQVAGNTSEYSVSPGFIITNKDFSLTIKSNLDQATTINTNFPEEQAITLQPGTNSIQFQISSKSPGLYLAAVGKYTIPVQITASNQQANQSQETSVVVSRSSIRETLQQGKPKSYTISILNPGSQINNIYFNYDGEVFSLDKEAINSIESNESINLTVTLKELNKPIFETILIASENKILGNISFDIFFTTNESEITNSSNPEYYCSELGGKFCAAAETCSTQTIQALDGQCCTGECKLQESSSGSSWIFYILIIVVLIILFVIYRKYKSTRLPKPKGLPINAVLKKPI